MHPLEAGENEPEVVKLLGDVAEQLLPVVDLDELDLHEKGEHVAGEGVLCALDDVRFRALGVDGKKIRRWDVRLAAREQRVERAKLHRHFLHRSHGLGDNKVGVGQERRELLLAVLDRIERARERAIVDVEGALSGPVGQAIGQHVQLRFEVAVLLADLGDGVGIGLVDDVDQIGLESLHHRETARSPPSADVMDADSVVVSRHVRAPAGFAPPGPAAPAGTLAKPRAARKTAFRSRSRDPAPQPFAAEDVEPARRDDAGADDGPGIGNLGEDEEAE